MKTLKPLTPMLRSKVARLETPGGGNAFYNSPEWRALRDRFYKTRPRICVKCGETKGKMYADHIVEIRDGGNALDESNLQMLCFKCHAIKTGQAQRERNVKARFAL